MLFPLNSIGYEFNWNLGLIVLGAIKLLICSSRLGSALRQLYCPVNIFALIFFLDRATESQNAKVTWNTIKETTHPGELDLCSLVSLLALLALSCLRTSASWPAQSLLFSSSLALESNEPSCGSLLLCLILLWQSSTCCPRKRNGKSFLKPLT